MPRRFASNPAPVPGVNGRRNIVPSFLCKACGSDDVLVRETRAEPSGGRRRRYECQQCHERFSTLERVVDVETRGGCVTLERHLSRQALQNLSTKDLLVEIARRIDEQT